MSLKIGDDNKRYLIKWNGFSSKLELLTYDYTTWNATSSQYDMALTNTKVLSYTTPFLYGYDTTTQTNPTASIARAMKFNTITATHSMSVIDNTKIYFEEAGTYNIQFSAQLDKEDSGVETDDGFSSLDDVDIWFSKNGQNIPYSNRCFSAEWLTLHGNNAKTIPSWNFVESVDVGDYIEIYWSSADTNMRILTQGTQSSPNRPAIPSVIITVFQVYTQFIK